MVTVAAAAVFWMETLRERERERCTDLVLGVSYASRKLPK
jgi:hypothetical protein